MDALAKDDDDPLPKERELKGNPAAPPSRDFRKAPTSYRG